MDGYRGAHAGMGDLGWWGSDAAAAVSSAVTGATSAVTSAVSTVVGPSQSELDADVETSAELVERAAFARQFLQAFGQANNAQIVTDDIRDGVLAVPLQTLHNAQGQLVDGFAKAQQINFRTLSAENKNNLMALWDEVEGHLITAGVSIPRVWDKPIQEWVGWGYDKGVLIIPIPFGSTHPRPDFLQPQVLQLDNGTTQVNDAAFKVWNTFCSGPVRDLVSTMNQQWLDLGRRAMAAADARVAQAEALLRCTQAVATLGLSELGPIMKEKWDDMKAKYADFRAKVKQYNDLMNNPSISAKDKEAARASAGPIIDKVSALFGDESSGKSLDQRLNEESGASAVAGLGVFAALPAIWAGIQITGVVIAIGILVWAIAKLWPIISALLKLLGGLNKMTGGLLIPALIVGGVGWIVWRKFGGKAKSLFAKG